MGARPSSMGGAADEPGKAVAPERELYALLNVSPTASADEIRRAYRSLAQVAHPDKHLDPQMKEVASESFKQVHEAYNILIDEGKRRIYDVYGMEGVKSHMELGPHLDKQKEIKEELERLSRKREQEKFISRSIPSVSLSAGLSLPHYLSGGALMRRMEMSSEVHSQLSKRNIVAISGNMVVADNNGNGTATAMLKHRLSPATSIEFMASAGLQAVAVLQASRRLSQHSSATSGLAISLRDGSINMSNTWTRRLSEATIGHIQLVLGNESVIAVGWKRKEEKSSAGGELKIAASSFGASGHYTLHLSPKSHARIAGRIGSSALEFEIGGGKKISDSSTIRVHYNIGIQGVSWRFELLRGAQKLVIPVLISSELNAIVATSALVIPSSLYLVLKKFVAEPLKHRYQREKARKKLEWSLVEVRKAREAAKKQQKLLENVANRNKISELEKDGLIITKALYGNLKENGERVADNQANEEDVTSEIVDVTMPLNFLVSNSRLELPKGIKKSGIMGFCDPCPETPKKLLVQYTFKGQGYEVIVDDTDVLVIPPQNGHQT